MPAPPCTNTISMPAQAAHAKLAKINGIGAIN